jgi:hypothetical protein
MAKTKDILMDENGEEKVKDGDFEIGDSTQQNQKLLILCETGENKMEPDSGVGINSWILDEASGDDLKKRISNEFEADGLRVESISGDSLESLTVKAKYP